MGSMIHAYRQTAVSTSDPGEILVMLYDGFLRFAHSARVALESGEKANATREVGRALGVVHELTLALDHGPYADLSQNLEALYLYINRRLLEVSSQQSITALDEVVGLMTELREAWIEARAKSKSAVAG